MFDYWTHNAAKSIAEEIERDSKHPARPWLDELLLTPWSRILDPAEYSQYLELRAWLEYAVGLGFGVFDLAIIDEAHKSRMGDSGLSRLLANVIVPSAAARRLAMTATPVELDVSQWDDILRRIGLADAALDHVQHAIQHYADAVWRLRHTWRSSPEGTRRSGSWP